MLVNKLVDLYCPIRVLWYRSQRK